MTTRLLVLLPFTPFALNLAPRHTSQRLDNGSMWIFERARFFSNAHPDSGCETRLDGNPKNSPPCICSDRTAAWNFLTNGSSSDVMPIADRGDEPDVIKKAFPEWSHQAAHDRKCARFAVDLSGGYSGEASLRRVVTQLRSSEYVDVFTHLIVLKSSEAAQVGSMLESGFGDNLRAATIEVWDDKLNDHVFKAYNSGGLMSFFKEHVSDFYTRVNEVNTLSMWRNIFLASFLRRQYMRQHDCTYEVVVRTRPDLVMEGIDFGRWATHVKDNRNTVVIGCHSGPHRCRKRAELWPAGACWLDDQLAIGSPEVVSAYENLFPDFSRFSWWFPYEVNGAYDNFPERLLLAHMDWRARAARLNRGPPFSWSSAGLEGAPCVVDDIDHSEHWSGGPVVLQADPSEIW